MSGPKLISALDVRHANARRDRSAPPRSLARTFVSLLAAVLASLVAPSFAGAIGESSLIDLRVLELGPPLPALRESAPRRLAWELRKRTSIDTRLDPSRTRLDDPGLFDVPFLLWSGEEGFAPLDDVEVRTLRRFVTLGGFVLIDDAAGGGGDFEASVRRELGRAFPDVPLAPIAATHTIYRSFYLVNRPLGRVRGPDALLGIELEGRMGVVMSRHDLMGAFARDNLGNWELEVVPGGDTQREEAMRLAVNLVMYALCLDYKDDQVHAPFIMRRRRGEP